ncbi:MAG: LCP family protein, partial [Eubacterium sp.]|nr:LCP family protein [Eubacterium sp.]
EHHHHHPHHHHSSDGEHHHHHHHSSDGEHHHSSDSSHRHSSSHHHHSSSSSHHHSSSKKKKSKSKKSKDNKLSTPAKAALSIIGLILLAIVTIIATFFILKAMGEKDIKTTAAPQQETIEYKGHTYKYNNDVFALGFIGVDTRELETKETTDYVGAADTDMVVAVNTKTGESKVIAIPRDTMVDIDISSKSGVFLRTEKRQLCLAYAYGDGAEKSCTNSTKAMSRVLLGVPIQKYYALDLDGIAALNDAIGGVTLTSLYTFKDADIKKGEEVTLRGRNAETYVRERSLDDVNASLNRTERQVQYIKAYASQLLPQVVKDFSVVSRLYNTANEYSRSNISLSNATYLASLLLSKGVNEFDTHTLQGKMKESEVMEWADVVHAEFYTNEDDLMQTVLDTFYTRID